MKKDSKAQSNKDADNKALRTQITKLESQVQKLQKDLDSARMQNSPLRAVKEFARKTIVLALILLTAFNLSFGVSAIWLKRNVINTDTWVSKTTDLIENPDIRQQISSRITDRIFTQADVETYVAQVLPAEINGLAGPLTSSLEGFTTGKVDTALQSEQFIQFWQTANRSAHAGIVSSLDNGGVATDAIKAENIVYIDGNELILNLKPVFTNIKTKLSEQGLTFVDRFSGDRVAGTVTLTKIDNMSDLLYAFNIINKMAYVLPILGIATAVGALLLARSKRVVLMSMGIVTALFMIGQVQLIYLANFQIADSLSAATSSTNSAASQAFYSIMTRDLVTLSRTLFAFSLLVTLGAFLAGPSKLAVATREKVGALLTFNKEDSGFIAWVAGNAQALVIAFAAIAILLLFLPIGGGAAFSVTVVTLAVLASFIVLSIAQANK